MIKSTYVESRPNTTVSWYFLAETPENRQPFRDLLKELKESALMYQKNRVSEDGLTRTVVRYFINEEVHNSFLANSAFVSHRTAQELYNNANGIQFSRTFETVES